MSPIRPSVTGMWVSMREAAELLAEIGINRESARVAMNAGLVGGVRRAGGARLVRERSVRAVIDRARQPPTPTPDHEEARRHGVFVARLGPCRETPEEDWRAWRGADLTAAPEEQRLAASGWWSLNALARAGFRGLAEGGVRQPFVGVLAGIAVVGAEIVGLTQDRESPHGRRCRFELAPPTGDWYAQLEGRQLLASPGPPWVTWPLATASGR